MSEDSAGADPGQSASAQQVPAQRVSGHGGTEQEGNRQGDAGRGDTGQRDAGRGDTGQRDAGHGDTGQGDARQEDAGHGDAGGGDAGGGDAVDMAVVQEQSWQTGAGQHGPGGWDVPWPESPAAGTGAPGRADLELAFATAMRRTGSLMQLMGQAAADRIGINATDLNCLNILSFSGHMTAGELARATGLTTASITGVIDRLEEAGFVSRQRDPHDRRRVVVTIALDRAMRDVASVFLPVLRDWRELAARYSDDELRLIVDFYARMEQVFRNHVARLRTEGRDG
jgi:DNA-binding MarR family transcriptional regulator